MKFILNYIFICINFVSYIFIIFPNNIYADDQPCQKNEIDIILCFDGIKLRFGKNTYYDDVKLENVGSISTRNNYINSNEILSDSNILKNEYGNFNRGTSNKFLIIPTLKPVEVKFLFSSDFYDWELGSLVENIPPTDNLDNINTDSLGMYMRQDPKTQIELKNNYFNSLDKIYIGAYPDTWALSTDILKYSIAYGKKWGINILPIADHTKLLQFALGFGVGFYYYDIITNLCSRYSISLTDTDSEDNLNYYDGLCENKVNIDRNTMWGLNFNHMYSFVLYEYVSNRSVIQFINIENILPIQIDFIDRIISVNSSGVHGKKLTSSLRFDGVDFLSYTYRFK